MSYDLAVFDPEAAPRERAAFIEWYEAQTEWEEPHRYNDPVVSTPALRAWFLEMIREFPAMNGPHAARDGDVDDRRRTDYSVGRTLIYAAFAWSQAGPAYEAVFGLAAKHAIGFFDASGETGEVWLPDGRGGLMLAHASRPT